MPIRLLLTTGILRAWIMPISGTTPPGSGRFTTADPYQASAGTADPSSWNRYSYVDSDPINRYDPDGLFWILPGSGSFFKFFNPFGIFQFLGGIFGGGGGSSFAPVKGPDPGWQTSAQVRGKVDAWDLAIAAALVVNSTRGQDGPGFRYVAHLNVIEDCYIKQYSKNGSAVRRRTYQAIDNFGKPYGSSNLTINEQN